MTIRMRHTRGHSNNRRSHHGLETPRLSRCSECGAMHIRHTVCDSCGTYRGKKMIDTAAVLRRKEARKEQKLKARGEEA